MHQTLEKNHRIHIREAFCLLVKATLSEQHGGKLFFASCRRYFMLMLLVFAGNMLSAQSDLHFSVSDNVIVSSASRLPFWLWANQDGKINPQTSFLNLTDVSANGTNVFGNGDGPRVSYGVTLAGGFEKESYLQLNRLYGNVDYRGWEITAGMNYDPPVLEDLSATNGNLARSRNYRPYPRIGLGTSDFKPLPFFREWLRFRLEYDEGILNDRRYVEHTHLHHKAIYFKAIPETSWSINVGVEHFVMWGGTSPDAWIGKLPKDFKAYLRYITGANGNGDFPGTDQKNVAGNQYGTYQLQVTKSWNKGHVAIYLSHPFEDLSGVNWRNYPDNLIGVHWHQNDQGRFLTDVLYEFTDSRQQGITDSLYVWNEAEEEWRRIDHDNYFNNSVYRSGVTYHQMAMGSPLFAPVIIDNGISKGFGANRIVSHHFGMKGQLTTGLYWKAKLTATQYAGTYGSPYVPEKNQLSGLLQFNYKNQKFPFDMRLAFAFDSGTLYENALGIQLGISREW